MALLMSKQKDKHVILAAKPVKNTSDSFVNWLRLGSCRKIGQIFGYHGFLAVCSSRSDFPCPLAFEKNSQDSNGKVLRLVHDYPIFVSACLLHGIVIHELECADYKNN